MLLPKAIQIGPVTFHSYGFIFALSILAGWLLARKRAHLYKQSLRSSSLDNLDNLGTAGLKMPKALFDDPILLIPLALGIAGARLYHVIDYWDLYVHNLLSIIYIQNGGLGIWGGLAGVFIGFWIVAKTRKLHFLSVLDLVSPSLLLGQAIGRFGNWVNQEAFGPPTNLPWGIFIRPENRPSEFVSWTHFHPTFFYEAAIDFVFFLILLYLSFPRKRESQTGSRSKFGMSVKQPGRLFALYLIFYSIGRFFVEFFRIDTATIGTVKVAQVLAVAGIAIGLLIIKFKKPGLDPVTS